MFQVVKKIPQSFAVHVTSKIQKRQFSDLGQKHLLTSKMINAKNTTELLKKLRNFMKDKRYVPEALSAYIIPSCDAHNSEYLAECDMRRGFISGFNGSSGTAIITADAACMWTDGRYFIQATSEMDSNWTLMKEGVPGVPTQSAWLIKTLPVGSKVGVDPKLMSYNKWGPLQTQLEASGHQLVPIKTNLVDLVWENKPQRPKNAINILPIKYTGKCTTEKLDEIRKQMDERKASLMVISALDEIAWLLNLRGSDIQYNPVFFSYVIITSTELHFFIDLEKISDDIKTHFVNEGVKIIYHCYEEVENILKELLVHNQDYTWISDTSNYALTSLIDGKRLISEITPLPLMKALKNPVEVQGMKNSHIRDAAALCCYFSWLEKEVPKGNVTEISGANKLEEFRKMQEDYVGLSFATISSSGAHGAIIHYQPNANTDIPITIDAMYLCDSGGQYKDGTTDVTRTIHLGTPTDYQKEMFTRVLKGQMFMGRANFPKKVKGNTLDTLARKYLWDIGLDYMHGTGHGIGAYLNVHEGPMGITWRVVPDDPGLEENMFLSIEPGYYEENNFGVRIENIAQIVTANTKFDFNKRGALTFETVTLVPIQTKLIATELLTDDEIDYLNAYHEQCRKIVGSLLEKQNQREALEWLHRETKPIHK